MDSYKDLYMHMMHETERAIRILQQAHIDCEEALLNQNDPELKILLFEDITMEKKNPQEEGVEIGDL